MPKVKRGSQVTSTDGSKKNVIRTFIGLVVVVALVDLAWQLQGKLNHPSSFPVQTVLKFNGDDQACGAFSAWDVTQVANQWIAISDQAHRRILIFDMKGQLVKEITQKMAGPPDFRELSGIFSDAQGHVYVMDSWNGMIRGFDVKGRPTVKVAVANSYGPRGGAWADGYFYAADTGTHRVAKISPDSTTVASWGHHGSGRGELSNPLAVTVDPQGFCYVADGDNHRIECLDSQGKFVRNYDVGAAPSGVALDSQGRVYASSIEGGFVKVFDKDGKDLGKLADPVQKGEPLHGLKGLSITADGNIIASHEGEVLILHPLPAGTVK